MRNRVSNIRTQTRNLRSAYPARFARSSGS